MITKKDAIKIAEAIANAGVREINMTWDVDKINKIPSVRGAIFAAVDNIWYDVLPMKTREEFYSDAKTANENYLDIVRNILNK